MFTEYICNRCGWKGNMLTAKFLSIQELIYNGYLDSKGFPKFQDEEYAFCPVCDAHIKIILRKELFKFESIQEAYEYLFPNPKNSRGK